jgi:O-antigen/teichoic acid export membrane protein
MSTGAAALTVAQVAVTGTFSLANLLIARSLVPAEFGRAAVGFNIQLVLIVVAGFGLTTAVIADSASSRASPRHVSSLLPLLTIRLTTAAVLVALACVWSFATRDPLVLLAGAGAAVFIVQDFLIGILKGELRATRAAIATVVQPVLFLAFVISFQLPRAEPILAASIAAFGVSLPFAAGGVARSIGAARRAQHERRPDFADVRRMAGFGYVLTFLQAGFFVAPILVLGSFGRYAEAAALSILMALVRVVPEVAAPVMEGVYFPRLRPIGLRPAGLTLFRRGIAATLLLTVPAGLAIGLLAGPVLHLLFSGRYDHAAAYLPLLAPLVVAMPIEALLIWTLISSGSGRPALVALTARLLVVILGATLFGMGAGFEILVVAPVIAVGASVALQIAGVRSRLTLAAVHADPSPDVGAADAGSEPHRADV